MLILSIQKEFSEIFNYEVEGVQNIFQTIFGTKYAIVCAENSLKSG